MGDLRDIRSAASVRRAAASGVPAEASAPIDPGLPAELVLEARPAAARAARHWVMRTVADAGVHGSSNQVIELLAGEIVANAVVHGPVDGEIRVRVVVLEDEVRVFVSDESTARPSVQHALPTDPGGRGMSLVAALSTAWGVEQRGPGGKTVWFSVGPDGD
ncbi:MAG TPA: ATP-binding protein [Cellulomonas sp.]|uniref:ATP-binding protein n=1 Tax=Cellulomonas sp. TaxID=40001 RepID=UPI002E33E9C4|nr:ATP-binding protein [Cellulomonas sp.]HEX5333654.1 ATP-binding protein [Cellulomonas sp.]